MKTLLSIWFKATGVIALMLAICSCEKNDGDQDLKNQLLGTWKSTNSFYRSYTFNENNTFIDTAFFLSSTNPQIYEPMNVISGDYLIKNGQLIFSDIKLDYFHGMENEYVFRYLTTYDSLYNISIKDGYLNLRQKDVFEQVNNSNSGIVGEWSHNKLVAVYDKSNEDRQLGGTLYGLYDFKEDLSVNWQYEENYGNMTETGNWSTIYELSGSKLTISYWGLYNLEISFGTGKMVWLYEDRTFDKRVGGAL